MISDREPSDRLETFKEVTLPTAPPPTDYYLVDELLKPEEREVRDRVRQWVDREVIPMAAGYWDRAEFPFELIPKFRELGLTGGPIRGYGSPAISLIAAGLVSQELARGDSSVATFYGVHSGLAMGSIAILGSNEQRERWLPAMARLEKIGAFALTEPTHGSDSIGLESRARREGNSRRTGSATPRSRTSSSCGRAMRAVTWADLSSRKEPRVTALR
jgi:glutaryl-CoA dehydrogenase